MSETDATAATLSPEKQIRAEITAYEKAFKPWEDRAKGVLDRYRDVRPEPVNQTFVLRKYNVLWANTEVLQPTLYARIPEVQVERRFKDKDPIGRLASEIAQRIGNYVLHTSDADEIFRQCVKDVLLPGRAVSWVSYEVDGEDKPVNEDYTDESGAAQQRPKMKLDDKGQPTDEPATEFEKIQEAVNPEYVDWRDFGHSPVRVWKECKTVWRKRFLDKPELVTRFGKDLAETIPLDRQVKDDKDKTNNIVPQATIYECWHKPTHKVYWLHKELEKLLDSDDPPIEIEGFWPCPAPIYATLTNETLIPIPDFIYYQDQANELDIVTNRIARLTDAMKVVGVYDSSVPALERILQPNGSPDNMLVPVTTWAAFKEKGGLAGAMELIPLQEIAAGLMQLYQARDQIIAVIYQVTGISDIIRGASDPNETLGAQKLKGQFGSVRIRSRQAEVARFCRDTARLIIECAVQMFEPKLIAKMTMAQSFCPLAPNEKLMAQQGRPFIPQSFTQALNMLKDDKLRSFHIDIETDSTIALNDADEKASVSEFVAALGAFFQTFGPVVQQEPALMPVMAETLLYATRRFRAGRALEASIEQAVDKIQETNQQPKPPSPEEQIAQAKVQGEQARSQADVQKAQATVAKSQVDLQKAQVEADAAKQTAATHQQSAQAGAVEKQANLALKAQDQHFQHGMDLRKQTHQENVDHTSHAQNIISLNMKSPIKELTK